MKKEIVFDIETIGNIRDLSTMKITVVSIYRYETDSYHSFEVHELGQLWPILETSDRLIGYNSEHFDLPILNRYYPGDLGQLPHLDLLKVIKESSGKRFKLDDIAKATLGIQKSADGLQAMEWFKQGELQKIKDYCEQDVKVTKDVYDFGVAQSHVKITTLTGEEQQIPVDFSFPDNDHSQATATSTINMTLPF